MIFFNLVFSTPALCTSGMSFMADRHDFIRRGMRAVVLDRRVAVWELIEDEEAEESDSINMTDE